MKFSRFVGIAILCVLTATASAQAVTSLQITEPAISYSNPAGTKYQQKTFWFPGGICSIVRTHMMPDLMTVATTMPEHLKASTVNMCIEKLSEIKFEDKFSELGSIPIDTLKDARTSNMTCTIVGQVQTPMLYQIRFSAFELTGKDREIEDCMTRAVNSSEKAPPRFLPGKALSL